MISYQNLPKYWPNFREEFNKILAAIILKWLHNVIVKSMSENEKYSLIVEIFDKEYKNSMATIWYFKK